MILTSIVITPSNVQAAKTHNITILTGDYWTLKMENSDNYIGTVNGNSKGNKYEKAHATATIKDTTLKITGTKQGPNTFYIYSKKGKLVRTINVTVKTMPVITDKTNTFKNKGTSGSKDRMYLYEGDSANFAITTSGWYSSISWTSSNTSVATVSGTSNIGAVATKTGAGTAMGATSTITAILKAVTDGSKGTYELRETFTVYVYTKPSLGVTINGNSASEYTMSTDDKAIIRTRFTNADKLTCSVSASVNSAYAGNLNLTQNGFYWELTMPEDGGLEFGESALFTVTAKLSAGDNVTANNGVYTLTKTVKVIRGTSTSETGYIELKDVNGTSLVSDDSILYLDDGTYVYTVFNITDKSGTIENVNIYSEDEEIVKVTKTPLFLAGKCEYFMYGSKEGTTTLTINANGKGWSHIRRIPVVRCSNILDVKVEDISLTAGEISEITYLGTTIQNETSYHPVIINKNKITLSSSDINVVDVENGKLVAKKNGTAIITATYSYDYYAHYYPNGDSTQDMIHKQVQNPTTTFKVNVYSMITDLKFSTSTKSIVKGEKISVMPTVYPQDEKTNAVYKWTTSDTTVATVDSNGKVVGKGVGKATTTATATDGSNKVASYTVYVKAKSTINVKAVSQKKGIKITWNKNDDASTYKIYRSTLKDGTYSQVGITTGVEYIDKSVVYGKTYYYKIVAAPSLGGQYESDFSSIVGTKRKLTTPKIKKFKVKKKGCKFKIKNSSYDGYIIYVGKSKKTKKIYGMSKKNNITLNVKKKGKYYVRVRAYKNVNGNLVYSNYSSAKKFKVKK